VTTRKCLCKGEGRRDQRYLGDRLQKKLSLAALRLGRNQYRSVQLQGTAGWQSLPCRRHKLGAQAGDREKLAKCHGAPKLLGSCQEGSGTGCTLEFWRLPILRAWPAFPRNLPISGGPQKTGKGRKRRRRRQVNERLQ
jgi:hypothetical protein